MSTFLDRNIAARAGHTTMSRLTPEQRTALGESGGNALLNMLGVQYYQALGRKSAQMRSESKRLGWKPRENGRRRAAVCEEAS